MINRVIVDPVAIRFGFMGQLLKWLEKEKNWKDGAYIDPTKQVNNY